MNKDIKNVNDKGQLHGYQERYTNYYECEQYKLWYRANFKNNILIGYYENHNIIKTNFCIR